MPNTCTVCRHPKLTGIDKAIVAGEPNRTIAHRHGLSEDAIRRHGETHLPRALVNAQGAKMEAHGASLLDQVAELQSEAKRIGKKAEEGGDLRTALAGLREVTRLVELLAKVSGQISESTVVNLVAAPEWLGLRTRLLAALDRHPQARAAVLAALDG